MSINPNLLIAAPMLQDYLVDDVTGLPLANGTITLYQDNSRTTLKNWYYQTGTPGNYTYIALPNPLTLSSVGTITDVNGNDTIPFYYPYSETDNTTLQPYYIVVVNSQGQQQFTRQNFPFISANNSGNTGSGTLKNLISNFVFWRNFGSLDQTHFSTSATSITINSQTLFYEPIAPSQHDGLTMPDWTYFKNTKDATETLSFKKFVANNLNPNPGFPDNSLTNDVTPEFYINLNCTGAGTETVKYIQVPICLHVDNFSGYTQASANIWAMNAGGANNIITLKLFLFTGTNATSSAQTFTLETITLSNGWQKYPINFSFPSAMNLTLSGAGDDAWYLQIGFPTGTTCNINIAKPSVYLSQSQPNNDFETYDQVESIINSPHTGDIRSSLNSFAPFGYAPMNDGTIGNAGSNSTSRANIDTWQLFNLLWQQFNVTSGATTPICQMYNSSGTPVNFGANAYADFIANNRLALTKMMGRILMGTVPQVNYLSNTNSQTYTASNDGSGNLLITVGSTSTFFKGQPVLFTTTGTPPGNLNTNNVFYISDIPNGTTCYISSTYANALASSYVAYSSAGTGTQTITNNITGTITGEYAHTLLQKELPDPITSTSNTFSAGAGATSVIKSDTSHGSGVVSNNGGNQSHNNVSPATFMNFFIKL